jgi:transcriptional regulator with XRE-family HTH domain
MARQKEARDDEAGEGEEAGGAVGFSRQVAANLRRLRQERQWTLEDLSSRAGVSRAMLSQVETGKTTPTIAVLWKIATGFGVPFTELLREGAPAAVTVVRAKDGAAITSADRKFRSHPLLAPGALVGAELYRIVIDKGGESRSPAHAPGTMEVVAVEEGQLRLVVGDREVELGPGDAASFAADVAHAYGAIGDKPCVIYDLVQYRPSGGGEAPTAERTRRKKK